MVTKLDSGSSGLGSSPGRGQCVMFLARQFILTGFLSARVGGGGETLRWTSSPFKGE